MSVPLLPIFVKLEGRPCLVVGAGAIGLQKVRSLLECAAKITVVAPEARGEVRELAEGGKLEWQRRRYAADDVRGQQLVIAATDNVRGESLRLRRCRDCGCAGECSRRSTVLRFLFWLGCAERPVTDRHLDGGGEPGLCAAAAGTVGAFAGRGNRTMAGTPRRAAARGA